MYDTNMYDATDVAVVGGWVAAYLIVYLLVMIGLIVLQTAALWKIFKKSGEEGWKCLVPIYNQYVLFDIIYGDGIRFLMLLIPFYNIYLMFKYNIDLARTYGKSTGFGFGLALLPIVFYPILGFGKSQYVSQQKW